MEYTDQEIEMLARFDAEREGFEWASLSPGARETNLDVIGKALRYEIADVPFVRAIRAAARLMRGAREQGAAEMREMAADLVRGACHDHQSTREILANIRTIPLTVPQ